MSAPPLVVYDTVEDYRNHYERVYCQANIQTFDGIRVYFDPNKFEHAFYESTARDGCKDVFSVVRAQRIDWIKNTLEHPHADLFDGWSKSLKKHGSTRRVAVVHEEFVVIIAISLKANFSLKAKFLTCYQADNSINKIRSSPTWSKLNCLRLLGVST